MSYGRTVQRHITRDEGFLSYPASAIVTVFAKQAHMTEDGEYWEAEVYTYCTKWIAKASNPMLLCMDNLLVTFCRIYYFLFFSYCQT